MVSKPVVFPYVFPRKSSEKPTPHGPIAGSSCAKHRRLAPLNQLMQHRHEELRGQGQRGAGPLEELLGGLKNLGFFTKQTWVSSRSVGGFIMFYYQDR